MKDAIPILCQLAGSDFKAILNVHLSDTNTSGHCIAVFDNRILDPADWIVRPLIPKSFADLSIDKIVSAFKITMK